MYTDNIAWQYSYYIYPNLLRSLWLRKQGRVQPLPEKDAALLYWGISLWIGGECTPANADALLSVLEARPSPLWLYCPDDAWRALIQSRLSERLREKTVRVYRLNHEDMPVFAEDLPCIESVTRAFMEKNLPHSDLIRDELYSYTDMEDYYKNGLGTALVIDGGVVGYCLSEYSADDGLGVNIWIDEAFRGQGYAGKLVRAFLHQCQEKQLTAYWVCDADNFLSNKVARSGGFTLESTLQYFEL